MSIQERPFCPECAEPADQPEPVDRRQFMRVVTGCAATTLVSGGVVAMPASVAAKVIAPAKARPIRPIR